MPAESGCARNSIASTLVSWSSAPFVIAYTDCPVTPVNPEIDAVLTMHPRVSRRSGSAGRTQARRHCPADSTSGPGHDGDVAGGVGHDDFSSAGGTTPKTASCVATSW